MGTSVPWWVPLIVVGVFATAVAYATSITATEMLGSRLASFAGLLEVVAAAVYAWILLGESLSVLQLIGGVLILVGIGFVRSERRGAATMLEPGAIPEPAAAPDPAPAAAPPRAETPSRADSSCPAPIELTGG